MWRKAAGRSSVCGEFTVCSWSRTLDSRWRSCFNVLCECCVCVCCWWKTKVLSVSRETTMVHFRETTLGYSLSGRFPTAWWKILLRRGAAVRARSNTLRASKYWEKHLHLFALQENAVVSAAAGVFCWFWTCFQPNTLVFIWWCNE